MQTRIPHLRILAIPALFALACILLYIVLLGVFGAPLPLKPQGYRIIVPLPAATNLVQGSDVQIAGVHVGEVVDLGRTGNTAQATIELQSRFAPLGSGATAIARSKTLLGEAYIEIAPGSKTARPIRDGGRLASSQVHTSVQLDEFLGGFDQQTRQRIRQLFGGLARTMKGRAQAFNGALGRSAPFAASLSEVLGTLESQRTDLGRVVARSGDVLQAVGERAGVLRAAVSAGDDVFAVTAARNRELAATVRGFAPFLRQLQTTSRTLQATSPDLNAAVIKLEPVAPLIPPALAAINQAGPEFRPLFNELPATLAAGRRGLPTLPNVLASARKGFKGFYPTSRQLIPFMQLLAVNKVTVAAILANVGSLTAGTSVGPEGRVLNYGTGMPTFWNESISGWARKLPTNRQNPYPKPPDSLLDTGRIGTLKAYDCRNTGNPLYLPPTGTGAPPCILQGPWKFNGKSAFYPRLHLAPP